MKNKVYQGVCHNCPELCSTVHLGCSDTGTVFYTASITFGYGDKEYRTYYYEGGFQLYLIQKSEVVGEEYKLVMSLPFSPLRNITPHNIKQKFPTLKVWS